MKVDGVNIVKCTKFYHWHNRILYKKVFQFKTFFRSLCREASCKRQEKNTMDAAQEYAAKLKEMGTKFHDIKAPEAEDVDRFKNRLMRTKTIQQPSFDDGDAKGAVDGGEGGDKPGLKKILSTVDLISLGVGSCCGTGMYVVSGLVAKNVAGPAAIFSFLIAAIASILSGKY